MSEEVLIAIQLVAVILWTVALCVFIFFVNCFHTVYKGNTKIQKGTISKFIDDYWDKGLDDDLVRAEISILVLCILDILSIFITLKSIYPNAQLENLKVDWSVFMGWAEVITLTVGILGVIGAIVGVILNDLKLLRSIDAKIGSLDNTTLSGEHQNIIKELSNKIGVLDNTTLSGQNNDIKKVIDEFVKKMENKEQTELMNRQYLTNDMNNIARSVDVLASFKEVMVVQQAELYKVKLENLKLTYENQELSQKNNELKQQLKEYEQSAQLTPDEPDFSQPEI